MIYDTRGTEAPSLETDPAPVPPRMEQALAGLAGSPASTAAPLPKKDLPEARGATQERCVVLEAHYAARALLQVMGSKERAKQLIDLI